MRFGSERSERRDVGDVAVHASVAKSRKEEEPLTLPGRLGPRLPLRPMTPWLVGVGALLLVTNLFPLVKLVQRTFAGEGRFSLEHLRWVIESAQVRTALLNSLYTSALATLLAVALALPLAAVTTKAHLPGRSLVRLAILAPMVIPPHVLAIAWQQWAGPVGYLQRALRSLFDLYGPLWSLYGAYGIVALLAIFSLPIAFLTAVAGMVRIPRSVEEAAMCEGASTWQVWRFIVLPLIRPHILAAAVLVFLSALGNFGIPALLGIPAQFSTLPTLIYRQVASFSLHSFGRAASLGLLFGGPVVLVLLSQTRLLKEGDRRVLGEAGEPGMVYSLGRWRLPVQTLLFTFVLLGVVGPLLSVALTASLRAYGVPLTWENLTFDHFRFVLFELDRTRVAVRNSLLLATGSALVTSVLASIVGYLVVRGRAAWLQAVVNLPYALPGIVFALSLILVWISPPVPGLRLYGTLGLLFIAYLGRFLALALQPIAAAWQQLDTSIEEAAKVDGANFVQSLIFVLGPMIAPSLAVAALLVFLQALVELTLSALLSGSGTETLGFLIFGLEQGGYTTQSAALSTLLLIALLAPTGLLGLLRRRQPAQHLSLR